MDENNELRIRLRAVGMELFRRDGLRFTMQQAAAVMHISKKTIYAVYPSKEALLLDMVDDAFTRIHARKQRILDGPRHPCRKAAGGHYRPAGGVHCAGICSRWIFWMKNIPESQRACGSIWKLAGSLPWRCWSRRWGRALSVGYPCRFCSG